MIYISLCYSEFRALKTFPFQYTSLALSYLPRTLTTEKFLYRQIYNAISWAHFHLKHTHTQQAIKTSETFSIFSYISVLFTLSNISHSFHRMITPVIPMWRWSVLVCGTGALLLEDKGILSFISICHFTGSTGCKKIAKVGGDGVLS